MDVLSCIRAKKAPKVYSRRPSLFCDRCNRDFDIQSNPPVQSSKCDDSICKSCLDELHGHSGFNKVDCHSCTAKECWYTNEYGNSYNSLACAALDLMNRREDYWDNQLGYWKTRANELEALVEQLLPAAAAAAAMVVDSSANEAVGNGDSKPAAKTAEELATSACARMESSANDAKSMDTAEMKDDATRKGPVALPQKQPGRPRRTAATAIVKQPAVKKATPALEIVAQAMRRASPRKAVALKSSATENKVNQLTAKKETPVKEREQPMRHASTSRIDVALQQKSPSPLTQRATLAVAAPRKRPRGSPPKTAAMETIAPAAKKQRAQQPIEQPIRRASTSRIDATLQQKSPPPKPGRPRRTATATQSISNQPTVKNQPTPVPAKKPSRRAPSRIDIALQQKSPVKRPRKVAKVVSKHPTGKRELRSRTKAFPAAARPRKSTRSTRT